MNAAQPPQRDDAKQVIRTSLNLTDDALHAVLNDMGHPFVLLTEDGLVVEANDASARAIGRDVSSLVGSYDCPFLSESGELSSVSGFFREVVRTGQRQDRQLRCVDRWWHVYLIPVGHSEFQVGRFMMLAHDITDMKMAHAAEIAREKASLQIRVRDVHHRIRNHLQGLVGLLRASCNSQGRGGEIIDTAVARILSIATVHGLFAQGDRTSMDMADLVEQIVSTQQLSAPIPVRFTHDQRHRQAAPLTQEETVPLAVVIGELLANALKHTEDGPEAYVEGTLLHRDAGIEFDLSNGPARLPEGFCVSGQSLQGGLCLVQALLPRDRSKLEITEHGERVRVRLSLHLGHE